jgi:hypothetical protein
MILQYKMYSLSSGVEKVKTKTAMSLSIFGLLLGSSAASLVVMGTANAAISNSYTLFGDAAIVSGGNPGNAAQISNSASPNYGGVDYTGTGVATLSDLNNLSTDYKFTQGSCELGSPRFVASITNGTNSGNIMFYIGPTPNYASCPQNVWSSTGNLAAPTNLVDTSQLPGGTFYDTYASAQAKYGNYTVTDLFVVDDDYANTQTVLLDNTQVNSTTFNYDQPINADSCKNGGWQNLMNSNGQTFKNQGQCVSYAQHNNGVGRDDTHAH